MFHILYQTTNKINNKIYIGVHSSETLEDGYLGSGLHLKRAMKHYGRENFERQVLCFMDSAEDAYELEGLVVDEEFVGREDTYNLCVGGRGPMRGGAKHTLRTKEKMRKAKEGKIHPKGMLGKRHTEESLEKISVASKGQNNPRFKGYWHTPFGTFDSSYRASEESLCTRKTLKARCLNPDRTFRDKKGLTWREKGWWFEPNAQEQSSRST